MAPTVCGRPLATWRCAQAAKRILMALVWFAADVKVWAGEAPNLHNPGACGCGAIGGPFEGGPKFATTVGFVPKSMLEPRMWANRGTAGAAVDEEAEVAGIEHLNIVLKAAESGELRPTSPQTLCVE